MKNKCSYEIRHGQCKCYFKIYQAVNGSIQLMVGNCNTTLTRQQILDLHIDLFELIDFDDYKFIEFYDLGE